MKKKDKIPVLDVSHLPVHVLTSAECIAEAKRNEDLALVCVNPRLRRYHEREARGWRKLAEERS